jgi:hypothetical protein
MQNNFMNNQSRPALKTRRIFDDDDDAQAPLSGMLQATLRKPQESTPKSQPELINSVRGRDYNLPNGQLNSIYQAQRPQESPVLENNYPKTSPTLSNTDKLSNGMNTGRGVMKAQSFSDYEYRQKPEPLQHQVAKPAPTQPSFASHFQQSPPNFNRQAFPQQQPQNQRQNNMNSDNMNYDKEIASLKEQKAEKERELYELRQMLGLEGQPSVSPSLLSQCIQTHRKLKAQEAELKDLKLNYNLLKEETEKQRHDLARLESGNDLDRIPRTKEELVAQNQKFKEKIKEIQRDYEKTLYDKTLEIELKARSKMHQIAMDLAVEHIDTKDTEMQELVKKVKMLELENRTLEQEKSLNASLVN